VEEVPMNALALLAVGSFVLAAMYLYERRRPIPERVRVRRGR
jgi:hypothetical protein